ncbi:E3 ubiquitin-protein ligase sina-like isoform X1 [Trichoplusia ni]|uniref:E3 ubiquitin-protein ligase n=2 Tax=Trichoplusia ni TaxID=7111 RepID=A0A7E5VJS4_TRINI|nr:E3 ubiquitin-protein ligase sina-like isoform X1 [Trichoplusia ni]
MGNNLSSDEANRQRNHPQSYAQSSSHHSHQPLSFNYSDKSNAKPPHDFVVVKNPQRHRERNMAPSARAAPRQQSQSRQRNRSAGGNELNCPTCSAPFGVNIFQCGQGHSSCVLCKSQDRSCGICGMALTDMRNYLLEDYVSQTKGNCPHAEDGCKLVLKVSDIETHIRECPFKIQTCPLDPEYETCVWSGKLKELSNHFERYHRERWLERKGDNVQEMQLNNVVSSCSQVYLIVQGFFNFLFFLQVSEINREVYMAVQLIGTKHSAEKWIYEIHLYNKNQSRKKYTFTDNCTSNVECIKDVFDSKRCAVLPLAYINSFVNNGSVTFKVFVKSLYERKPLNSNTDSNQAGRVGN